MRSGAIIALTDKGVVGWAIDHEEPEAHFRVVVLGNGQPLGVETTTDAYEAWVKAACGEARPSFAIPVQAKVELSFPLELELRDSVGTLLGPPLRIEQSDHLDLQTLGPSATAYEGFCDREVNGRLEGWVWNMCIPQLPVILEVLSKGEIVNVIKADRFRPDLKEAGKRNGSCGFSIALPLLQPGMAHQDISLRIAGTMLDLQRLNEEGRALSWHDATHVQVPAIEQQLLSMGGGHPNTAYPETPAGGAGTHYVAEREAAFRDLEIRLQEALRSQNSRLDGQEAILAATRGTIDNLVRTWLQLRNEIALLREELASFRELPKDITPSSAQTAMEIANLPKRVAPMGQEQGTAIRPNLGKPLKHKGSVSIANKRKIKLANDRRPAK